MVRKWMNRALLGLGWGALVTGIAGIVLYFGAGSGRQLPVLLASGASYLMLGALVALTIFLLARGWRSAAAAGIVVVGVLWTQVPIFVADSRAASGPVVTVMQSNLLFGGADVTEVVRTVRAQRVDLLTIDELTQEAADRLSAAGVAEYLPYQYTQPRGGGGGTGIYSRYPLRDTRKYDGFLLDNLAATMDHPQRGPVAVFAFHPVPPTVDFHSWSTEMHRIREILDAQTGPALVGADFNATRDHAVFRDLLRGRFASAAELAGAGRLPTYPADRTWGPIIGIDHILVADGTAEEMWALTIPGSDHRAVLARTRLDA
ncbi:endonuclease/exonuclease/phosphatase family protein [Nocardia sp. NPDC005366]|uniref:endonuclease/exonuclease/phosphatase family protein n=1 Tax=Nocardia sp. NPDC005366 TaxID=3156878 RepID=UPI0033AF886F